jgi:hypothetical protein
MNAPSEAPCVAIVGPTNAGKTSLLHQLDEKLKPNLDSFLVLKGNPDGTGRYMYHARDLRHDPVFKSSIKGSWGEATIDRICEWITHGRRNLSLALLDFGGRHDEKTAEGNARMLQACSHYLAVSRDSDPEGAAIWENVCRSHGLIRLGWMRSLPADLPPPAIIQAGEIVEATFCVAALPGDPINDQVLAPLIELLLRLSRPVDRTPYVNLHQKADWRTEQIGTVAGQAAKIAKLASRTGAVVVGGSAPLWAYLAALRSAVDANVDARVFFYDPKQPETLVEIPAAPGVPDTAPALFPADALRVFWRQEGDLSVLQIEIATQDKFLPPSAAQNLAGAPLPPPAPSKHVALSGGVPLWVHGTYARWLITSGARSLASWDGRMKKFVQVWSQTER